MCIAWREIELRAAVKKTDAIWRPKQKVWEMSWEAVRALGIAHMDMICHQLPLDDP